MNRRLALALLLVFTAVAAATAEDSRTQRAQELIARALQLGSLDAATKGPYRVEYRFKLMGLTSGSAEGTYSKLWGSAARWRREIAAHGFSEVTVANQEKRWVSRNMSYEPEAIAELKAAIEPALKLTPRESAVRISEGKNDGTRLQCVELQREGGPPRSLCFDQGSGALAAITTQGTRSEYSDFEKSGSALIAHHVRVFDEDRLMVDAQLVALTSQSSGDESAFAQPPMAEEWTTCENPVPGKLIKKQQPEYPHDAISARQQGTVRMYGVIDIDGTVKNLALTESVSKQLDKAALSAVRNWRYQPYSCDGVPIRVETHISVNFRLTH
jgi:TonB family protein